MRSKMGAKAPLRIKMPIVSKTYYLLCFSYILLVPETFKNGFLPSQFPFQLLSPPFGHHGLLKKRLGCHLQAINTKKCQKWSPKRAPILGPFLDILPLFAVPGALGSQNGSQGLPQEPPGPLQMARTTQEPYPVPPMSHIHGLRTGGSPRDSGASA